MTVEPVFKSKKDAYSTPFWDIEKVLEARDELLESRWKDITHINGFKVYNICYYSQNIDYTTILIGGSVMCVHTYFAQITFKD